MPILLQPGQLVFGRYKVIAPIGSGGQSFGYKAEDLNAPKDKPWERDIFIKQYRDLVCGSPEADNLYKHFRDLQIRLGEKDNYICLPINLGIEGNSVVAVYPWVEGKTLADFLVKGLDETECTRVVSAITRTINFIHKKGIAHLDLKPQNIVIEENKKDGNLYTRLVDLDASQIDGRGLRDKIIGTPGYSSPEHYFPAKHGKVSTKSDIFTLGILISEILFGEHPYIHSPSEYKNSISNRDFTFPESRYHKDIVSKWAQCLQPDPARRPTAATISFVIHKHYSNNLKPISEDDVWKPRVNKKLFVQIEGLGDVFGFRRTYYSNQIIGNNELRGTKINIPSKLFKLGFGHSCSLTLLDDAVEVKVEGRKLRTNQTIKLSSHNNVSIQSKQFLFKVDSY